MAHAPLLPDPWVHERWLTPDEHDQAESLIGSGLTYQTVADDEWMIDGEARFPNGPNAWLVAGHRWARIRNQDRGTVVLVRLQKDLDGGAELTISAVAFPYSPGLAGTDLRSVPLGALGDAYTRDELEGSANLARTMVLFGLETGDALQPLGRARPTDEFSALVARQYIALEDSLPAGANVTRALAELNDTSIASAQRWIARARKVGLLAPITNRGGRPARPRTDDD